MREISIGKKKILTKDFIFKTTKTHPLLIVLYLLEHFFGVVLDLQSTVADCKNTYLWSLHLFTNRRLSSHRKVKKKN